MSSPRESCVRVLKTDEVILKDPLDTLPRVYAAFLLGVLSFERINDRIFMRGSEKGPLVPSKGDVGCKEPGKIKIREKKYQGADRVEPYSGLYLYYASIVAHGIFSV